MKFLKGDGKTKGTWRGIGVGPGSSGYICCPSCGGRFSLVGIEISNEGKIDVVKCGYPTCKWVDEVVLDGWEEAQQPPAPSKKVVLTDIDGISKDVDQI